MALNEPTESSSAGNQHEALFQSMYCIPFLGHHSFNADLFSLADPVDPEGSPFEPPTFAQGQSANPQNATQEHAVRFDSVLQEIEPEHSVYTVSTLSQEGSMPEEPLSLEAQDEIRILSQSLQQSQLQHRRLSNYAFEPVSLPVSRVRGCYKYTLLCHRTGAQTQSVSSVITPTNP